MTTPNSKILVNSISAYDPPGPVTISMGATIPSGYALSVNGNLNIQGIVTAQNHSGINILSTGIVTATSFKGSASNMNNLPVASASGSIAFILIAT